MKTKFKRVILFARQYRANQGVSETLHRLVAFLMQAGIPVFQEEETSKSFHLPISILPNEVMTKKDLMVVVGGDGSLLSASRVATAIGVTVIGINRGRLGFLTDILPSKMEHQLTEVLEGHYQVEERALLKMALKQQDSIIEEGMALNDVVLSRGREMHLIEFEVYINKQFVSHYRADGLIISTPTGSTAYALSAGGPIMHPNLNAMVLVPMFSHSLSSRPLVVDGDANIDVFISDRNATEIQLSCDGHQSLPLMPGQHFSITKYPKHLKLLHPKQYHYYDTLRIKLGWGASA